MIRTLIVDACVNGTRGAIIAIAVLKAADLDVREMACVADADVLRTGLPIVTIGVVSRAAVRVVCVFTFVFRDITGADEARV